MKDTQPARVRLGVFELDLRSGELCAGDQKTVLQEQPLQILRMLVGRQGEIVTRDEIQKKLWPNDTVVEFDHSINAAIKNLRRALGDSADEPKYIETLARRGYRLMVPVEPAEEADIDGDQPVQVQAPQAEPGRWIGKRLSHYRVLEIIGGGGMGVVYRAEDLKLGRQVALKFLPEELAWDTVALERFEREARTASSLNHPNICTIYEVEEHEGHPFIVMELLEGQTLRDRLAAAVEAQVAFSLEELLDIGIQVSEGLEAAHEKSIIHRDIKPANIFLTSSGQVKILDFGLAKLATASKEIGSDTLLLETTGGEGTQAAKPVTDLTLTRLGVAMGTAGYMSPEQIRGEKLDARSDLFSFGLVLYEMATGQRAFAGETAAVLHTAILSQAPVAIHELNSTLPPVLEQIINKSLEKDRERRYRCAAGLRADLQLLKRDTESVSGLVPGSAKDELSRPYRRWWPVAAAALAVIVAVLAVGWYAWRSGGRPTELSERQLTFNSFETPVVDAAISPDGNTLAYADISGLYLKLLTSGEVHPLPAPANARIYRIAWFPNSQDLLVTAVSSGDASGQLWAVSVFGGAPRLLRSDVRDVSVSSDGSQIAFTTRSGDAIWVMDAAGEQAKEVVATKDGGHVWNPYWYPRHRRILYLSSRPPQGEVLRRNAASYLLHASLESIDLESGQSVTLVAPGKGEERNQFCVLPDGRVLFVELSNDLAAAVEWDGLWEVSTDLRTGRPNGKPHRVSQWSGYTLSHPNVSADGRRLVLLRILSETSVFVADLKDGGKRLDDVQRLSLGAGETAHAWTPNSQAVVFESNRNGSINTFKQGLNHQTPEPLVKDAGGARFSPDGKWLFYFSENPRRLMRMPASGGQPELVLSGANLPNYYCARLPANLCVVGENEQNQLVFYGFDPTQELPAGGIPPSRLQEVARTDYNPSDWGLSPDGSSIAMVRPDDGEGRIHILSLGSPARPGGVTSHDVLVHGWTNLFTLNWAADGKGWYTSTSPIVANWWGAAYCTGCSFLYVDLDGRATVLQSPESSIAPWGVPSPDGRHLAFANRSETGNAWLIENF